ncbi:MAG: asparagine synthase [Bacteroidales bacterium]|nr:asparagine synthase [Bacteroidales bacterium]
MIEDKQYCSEAFLIYRYIADENRTFRADINPYFFKAPMHEYPIASLEDTENAIRDYINTIVASGGRLGLALSGGIDSAILAKYVPADTPTYTFHCVAPGALDETAQARRYAEECGLNNKVIDITWDDVLNNADVLMRHKGAPIHSIEAQIYAAALQARADGVTHLLFGENADIVFGGMDGLLSQDWDFDAFVKRYAYLDPTKVLKNGRWIMEPFERFRQGDKIDFYSFIRHYFYYEANNSYDNACSTAGVKYCTPFNHMRLTFTLDYDRIRRGDTKYILREIFNKLYPQMGQPVKVPMPRAVSQWLASWQGPVRPEFIPHCADALKGDQRWMIFILERFLNAIEI